MLLDARVGRSYLKCSGRKLVLVTVSPAGIDSEMEGRIENRTQPSAFPNTWQYTWRKQVHATSVGLALG
jgi:hypothetical protein